ncbi:L-glutaminase [Pustulibacterium marinum]|uniref:Glutaminase n=1 Tax=Pustulibacterium marinum TaxID=1224947 RepID=A0A1I7G6C8_9FLAO|nr:glutaminase [Pustulibacterium marinum]SFU43978.1 L-glutaminase [Pustulibacterium marinum]
MDYQLILNEIKEEVSLLENEGLVANYIPELTNVDPGKLGMHLHSVDNKGYSFGDAEEKFSIQSISKVFSLILAYKVLDKDIWKRVDVEPSGDPFNSLTLLEYENGIPRNPFINSGAIVVADILMSHYQNPKEALLNFVRKISGNPSIDYNEKVALSEKSHGYRNAALANLMKSFGNIQNEVNDILDFYFYQCSLEMSCKDLSKAFLIFANKGRLVETEEVFIESRQAKRVNAIMQTCGFYDESGEFAFRVGLPGKSGVGGGIVAVHPGQYSVAVWSPRLNEKGNSYMGMEVLERLTTKTGYSIF